MLTGRIKIQLIVFCVIAAVSVTYVAANYVGLGRMVGLTGYRVTVSLPQTGGLFENAEVTYRGVAVGRVGSLTAGPDGVEAEIVITDEETPIPRDSAVFVRNRSAIGEQYLDLRPAADGAPWLSDGDHLTAEAEALPLPIDTLLTNVVGLSESVPIEDLQVLVDEVYTASLQSSDDLVALLDASTGFVDEASSHLDDTTALIRDAEPVLRTQADSSTAIRSFSHDLSLIASSLESSDSSIRDLIAATPGAARQIDLLFREIGQPLTRLMGSLLTLNGVLGSRSREIGDALHNIPLLVGRFDAALGDDGLAMGLTTNFTDPLPCVAGYHQSRRGPHQTTDAPLLLTDGCTAGPKRGASSAPHAE